MKLVVISGTNRLGSATLRVSRHVAAIHDSIGMTVAVLDLAELPVELFSPLAYESKPEGFDSFSAMVMRADGLVIVTPEYNGSFPGALKLFIDHLPMPASFRGKPVCLIGLAEGRWGGMRPVEQLAQVCAHREAHVFPERVFLPHIGEAFAPDGEWSDPELGERLHRQAENFATFCAQLARVRKESEPELPAAPNVSADE